MNASDVEIQTPLLDKSAAAKSNGFPGGGASRTISGRRELKTSTDQPLDFGRTPDA